MKIDQRWLQVYRQTVSHALVSKDHYEYLHARGWLDQCYQLWGSTRLGNHVQVYCIHVPEIETFVYTVIY